MTNTQKSQALVGAIHDAFPKTTSLSHEEIACDQVGDSVIVSELLRDRNWWLLSERSVEDASDKMALLTPRAFHYFLPSFLLRSLEEFDAGNETLQYTVFNLSPVKTAKEDDWFAERYRQFTSAQISVIREFLRLILDDESMYSLYNDAERGLKKFWLETS